MVLRPFLPLVSRTALSLVTLASVLTVLIVSPLRLPSVLLYALYLASCLLSCFVMYRAAARAPRPSKRGWLAVGSAVASFTAGEFLYACLDLTGFATPFPSVADVFYLAFVPLIALGVGLFPHRTHGPRERVAFLLDLLLAVSVATGILWHTTGLPVLVAGLGARPLDLALGLAYPASDLLLLGALFALVLRPSSRLEQSQLILLGVGMTSYLLTDLRYVELLGRGTYAPWTPLDLGWLWGVVLLALAGQVTPAGARERGERRLHVPAVGRILPYAALTLGYVVFVVARGAQVMGRVDEVVLGTITMLLFVRLVLAVQEQQKVADELRRRERHDELTGLANRPVLVSRLTRALLRRPPQVAGVLYVDLDRMRHVNDWHGHAGGDEVLREIAARLTSLVRADDLVARVEGDEFVVMLDRLEHPGQAAGVARRVLERLAQPVKVGDESVYLTASVGIAVCPRDAGDAELAVHHAYLAMTDAKGRGRNTCTEFGPHLVDSVVESGRLEGFLRNALERDELDLHYQPLVDLGSERVVGFEALLRWTSPTLGVVPPLTIVDVAEERGLTVALGTWVLRRAVGRVARWRRLMDPAMYVSVNVSSTQFEDPGFVGTVEEVLGTYGVDAGALCLELTERSLMRDVRASRVRIEALRALGVRVALDDFGTGYSSLSYLRQLPVDVLKIDQSFVRAMEEDGPKFVRAITRLGLDLEVTVVAEGIETAAQLDTLASMGCHVGQGYLLGRPMTAPDLEVRFERPQDVLLDDEG